MLRTHVAFCLDESGSVRGIIKSLIDSYNKNVEAISAAILREGQEATMTALAFGNDKLKHRVLYSGQQVQTIKPLKYSDLTPSGMTPLFDSVYRAIEELQKLDDNEKETSFIVTVVTDGQENDSRYPGVYKTIETIKNKIKTDRWTFTFLVPNDYVNSFIREYGIPSGNVQGWDERSSKGTEEAFVTNSKAYDNYFTQRTRGIQASSSFYSDLKGVSAKTVSRKMAEITSDVQFFTTNRTIEIRPLVEQVTSHPYVKGTAFYQLIKNEKRVQPYKIFAVRNKTSKKVYAGDAARTMLGLDVAGTISLHPGDHGNWDIFIQSTSNNRKIMPGMEIMIWMDAVNYK